MESTTVFWIVGDLDIHRTRRMVAKAYTNKEPMALSIPFPSCVAAHVTHADQYADSLKRMFIRIYYTYALLYIRTKLRA